MGVLPPVLPMKFATLSAINHAAQLLDEAEYLLPADKRLCSIMRPAHYRVELIIQNVLQIAKRQPHKPVF